MAPPFEQTLIAHNISTKYGFDILVISGSYCEHIQHMTYDGQQITPGVWHTYNPPPGELKIQSCSTEQVEEPYKHKIIKDKIFPIFLK